LHCQEPAESPFIRSLALRATIGPQLDKSSCCGQGCLSGLAGSSLAGLFTYRLLVPKPQVAKLFLRCELAQGSRGL
jgi:hypothetical protein